MSKTASSKKRVKHDAKYRSFRLQKRLRSTRNKIPTSLSLHKRSLQLLRDNKRFLALHALLFIILYGLFITGFGQRLDLVAQKDALVDSYTGVTGELVDSANLLSELYASAGQGDDESSAVLQLVLIVILSMSTLWIVRKIHDGDKDIRLRDAYYKGPAQFVPFVLVLGFMGIMLLPMVLGNTIASVAREGELIVATAEQIAVLSVVGLLNLFSLYLATAVVFGLIIASLPGTQPWSSIAASNRIVLHRRWQVILRVLGLLIVTVLITTIIMTPVLILLTSIAEYVFYAVLVIGFIFAHIYMYELYRSLIK